jgi:1,4-dihydroxy-2-naphthoate octaprenyltransferase
MVVWHKENMMADPSWPLPNKPGKNTRVILASQGVRIWTTECRLDTFGETMELACSDTTTLDNLRRQQRVAFTVIDNSGTIQGNGMARVKDTPGANHTTISVEPYRVATGTDVYEVRLSGWNAIKESPVPDISKYAFWYQAFRMVTLPLSALPVLVGGAAAFAQGHFNLLTLALALIGAVCAHAGANASADYFDFKKGVDSSKALSSHLGALARERVEPEMILMAAFACFLVTAIIGLILLQITGWGLLLFGLAGLLGAFFYTGRPISYKYRALGELMLGTLMGPITVMGAYYVQTRGWDWGVFLISVALGMMISSISLVNNLRDLPDDKAAGIRTMPMSLGVSGTKKLYYFLSWGPYLVTAAALIFDLTFWPLALVLLSLPQAFKAIRSLSATKNDTDDIRQKAMRNPFPLNSIRLHARFGELTVAGLALAGLIRIMWA